MHVTEFSKVQNYPDHCRKTGKCSWCPYFLYVPMLVISLHFLLGMLFDWRWWTQSCFIILLWGCNIINPLLKLFQKLLHLQTCFSMTWIHTAIGPLLQFMFGTCYLIIGSCGIKLCKSITVVLAQKFLPTKLLSSWVTNLMMTLEIWSLDCLHGSSLILFPNTTSYKLIWGEFQNKLLASPMVPLLCVSSLIKAAWGTADFELKLLVDLVLPPLFKSHPPIYLTIPGCKSVSQSMVQ